MTCSNYPWGTTYFFLPVKDYVTWEGCSSDLEMFFAMIRFDGREKLENLPDF
jgi:hypothetical protein